ncbi:putative late blight resistance protein homolog R1A-10 [Cynara cardunculus var. scolymus]|uniref:putative late blight resistance protein homolog R1A-10 n=1 Tax=Cynara cardunculus var. scolymus TaxID=59895 RepID=UPI000D6307E2|nr:putative late blight resistance protein homolog R1A-10 [Cynara cardunculus var. scolymus]
MIDTDVDCLIETLKHLINFNHPSQICKTPWIDQLQLLHKGLTSLRTFLTRSEDTRYTVEKVKALVLRIIDVAIEVEHMVDSFVASFDNDCFLELDNVVRQMETIKRDVSGFDDHKIQDLQHERSSSRVNPAIPKEDNIIGFDVEAREILDRLVGNRKQLDVISIVGMGGLGKTTLAKRAYNDPYVAYHFYDHVWITVSQTYQKNDLLLRICSSLSLTITNEAAMNTGKLREMVYKRLKGKRYLIVIDDIWGVEAWDDIKICFSNDNNGSRILVTSRLVEVALHIKPDSSPHLLRFLTVEESWDLLQQKVFPEDGSCPKSLKKTGKQIAERCRGLPLAILVISGLLAKTEKTVEWWTRVLDGIGSYLVGDPEQDMNTLALSYNHLPQHLKSCFLYFGAFPEDFEIDVRKLLWLWVGEGFIEPATENIAEEYLINLVERSLVIVERKRLDGGIKVCRVHDLLHDLCFNKAKEENFLHKIKPLEEQLSSPNTSGFRATDRRLFIHSYVPDYVISKPSSSNTRSFLLTSNYISGLSNESIFFLYSAFKHLRVFEFGGVFTPFLPSEIESANTCYSWKNLSD